MALRIIALLISSANSKWLYKAKWGRVVFILFLIYRIIVDYADSYSACIRVLMYILILMALPRGCTVSPNIIHTHTHSLSYTHTSTRARNTITPKVLHRYIIVFNLCSWRNWSGSTKADYSTWHREKGVMWGSTKRCGPCYLTPLFPQMRASCELVDFLSDSSCFFSLKQEDLG